MTSGQVIFIYLLTIISSFIVNSNVIGSVAPLHSQPQTKTSPTAGNVSNTSTSIQRPPTTEKNSLVASEGGNVDVVDTAVAKPNGDTTHNGREHMISVAPTRTVLVPLKNGSNSSSTTENAPVPSNSHMIKVPSTTENHRNSSPKPKEDVVHPAIEIAEKNDNKNSVPKKGVGPLLVDEKNSNSSSSTTTTVKPVKRKPTITESDDDAPKLGQQQQSNEKHDEIPSLDKYSKENNKKTDYVVPIVAVILSVPLVAIIISVLYKRGAEWWQHRHYRRMDFLIDGMYNN